MAIYANEDGTVQTLAIDNESLNVLYKQYTAKITISGGTASGTGTAAQTFTLPFTPKAVIAKTKEYQRIGTSNYVFDSIGLGTSINITGDAKPSNVNNYYNCTLRVNGDTVTITKINTTPTSTLTITFDVIFFY